MSARDDSPQPVPRPAPVYFGLRKQLFNLVPGDVGIVPSALFPNVWGVVVDIGRPRAVVTLVALADGTTSLYFGSGGGLIGYGQQPAVAIAAKQMVTAAERFVPLMEPAETYPLPMVGGVCFYVLAFSGVFAAAAGEQELGEGHHAFSPFFYSGQGVIAQVRLHSEQGGT